MKQKECDCCKARRNIDSLVKQDGMYRCFDCIVNENNLYYFGEETEFTNEQGAIKWLYG